MRCWWQIIRLVYCFTGVTTECPIDITPERMITSYDSSSVVSCTPKPSAQLNLKEIYWEDKSYFRWGDNHWHHTGEWDPQPVCFAIFWGLERCKKPLNLTIYSMYLNLLTPFKSKNNLLMCGYMKCWQIVRTVQCSLSRSRFSFHFLSTPQISISFSEFHYNTVFYGKYFINFQYLHYFCD